MNLLGAIGQARPVSDFINTAGQFQANQSNLETQKLQREMLQAKAAQEAKDNAEYDVDAALSLYPEHVRPIFKKALVTGGRVQNNVVRGVDMRGIPELIRKDPALALSINQADLEWNRKEAERLAKKGDPKSQEQALQHGREAANLQKLINKDLGEKSDKYKTVETAEGVLPFNESTGEAGEPIGQVKPKELTPSWKPVADKDSPTGLSYQDLNTGKKGGPAPAPQMQMSKEYKQYVGTTPDGGNAIVFDARAGKFTTEPLPGGELPGVKGKKSLPSGDAETLGKMKTTWQDIKLAREAWNEGLTGAFQGRANEALQAVSNHPAFEKLRRRTNRLITVAYALSGKQISEKEIQILKKSILPQVEQMDQNFLTALDELQDWVERNAQNAQEAYTKSNYQFEPIFEGNAATPSGGTKSFATESEAEAAAKRGQIKAGDKITIGGKSGTWR